MSTTPFKANVIKIVSKIPRGKVMSYGQIAACMGTPRAARQVGWILRSIETVEDLPWWRVVNNEGIISIKGNRYHNKSMQKSLLEKEGLKISPNFTFYIEDYRFSPSADLINKILKRD